MKLHWLICLQLAACADSLDSGDVDRLKEGDAHGSAFSGEYAFTLDVGEFYCEEGLAFYYLGDLDSASVQQTDGRLRVVFPFPLFSQFPGFTGGIYANGSFTLGASTKEDYTTVMLVDGFTSGNSLKGTFDLRMYGSDLECNANGTIAFTRP